MLALVDHVVRKVEPKEALGGRLWSNYTWHGDQAPGHPFVHGLQAADCDFNDMRHAKLHIQCGKNLVENKMPDSHWFIEIMERGGRIVVITPEYSPPATKADYWIQVRPGCTDTALFLGVTRHDDGQQVVRREVRPRLHRLPAADSQGQAEAPAGRRCVPGL